MVADCIKQEPSIFCLKEAHFKAKNTQTESEEMEEYISCKWK